MKNETDIIWAVAIFFLGVAVGAISNDKIIDLSFSIILPAFATLFAAYFGAKYAFMLQAKEKEDLEIETNIAAGNLAIFYLVKVINRLKNVDDQSLKWSERPGYAV